MLVRTPAYGERVQRVRDPEMRVQVGVREAVQQAPVQRGVGGGGARARRAHVLQPAQRPRRVQAPRQRQQRVAVPALHDTHASILPLQSATLSLGQSVYSFCSDEWKRDVYIMSTWFMYTWYVPGDTKINQYLQLQSIDLRQRDVL